MDSEQGILIEHAIQTKAIDIIQSLITSNSNFALYRKTTRNDYLIHMAIECDTREIIDYLLKIDSKILFLKNADGQTPLEMTIKNANIDLMQFLMTEYYKKENLTLDSAIIFQLIEIGNIQLLEEFLKYDINLEIEITLDTDEIFTPIFYTVKLLIERNTIVYADIAMLLIKKYKASIFRKNAKNETILHLLLQDNHYHMIKELIDHDEGILNFYDDEPILNYAIRISVDFNIIVLLLNTRSTNPFKRNTSNDRNAMHEAVQKGALLIVKQIIYHLELKESEAGSSVQQIIETYIGGTVSPFLLAVKLDYNNIVKYLLERVPNLNLNLKDSSENTALHIAVLNKNIGLVKLLSKKMDNMVTGNKLSVTAMESAIYRKSYELIEFMYEEKPLEKAIADLNRKNSRDENALWIAVRMHYKHAVMSLLNKYELNVNILNKMNESLLHLELYNKAPSFEILQNLIVNHKIIMNNTDMVHLNTPLNYAVKNRLSIEIITLLINNNADTLICDLFNLCPIHYLMKYFSSNYDLIKQVVTAAIDKAEENLWKYNFIGNAISYCSGDYENAESKRILLLLLEQKEINVLINVKAEEPENLLHIAVQNESLEIVKLLLSKKNVINLNINSCDKNGLQAIHLAIEQKHLEIFKLLIENGADLNGERTDNNDNLIQACIRLNLNQFISFIIEKSEKENIKLLKLELLLPLTIQHSTIALMQNLKEKLKLDVNAIGPHGRTPIFDVIENGSMEIFDIFIKYNPDLKQQDEFGQTILHLAARYKLKDMIVKILQINKELVKINNHKSENPIQTLIIYQFYDYEKLINTYEFSCILERTTFFDIIERETIEILNLLISIDPEIKNNQDLMEKDVILTALANSAELISMATLREKQVDGQNYIIELLLRSPKNTQAYEVIKYMVLYNLIKARIIVKPDFDSHLKSFQDIDGHSKEIKLMQKTSFGSKPKQFTILSLICSKVSAIKMYLKDPEFVSYFEKNKELFKIYGQFIEALINKYYKTQEYAPETLEQAMEID